MSATVKIILDTRRMKKATKKYPVKLQVTFMRTSRTYQTIFDLSSEDHEKLDFPRLSYDLQISKDKLKLIRRTAEEHISAMTAFGFPEFERNYIARNKLFRHRKRITELQMSLPANDFDFTPYYKYYPILLEKASRPGTISFVFAHYIRMLLQEKRIGSAQKYSVAYSSLKKFGGDSLFTEIDKSYLVRYEQWMLENKKSKTTVGIYLRSLRAIFNEANEIGIINKADCYPFGRRRYRIPTSRNVKKALGQDQIKAIYYYKPANLLEERARDFWLFFFFSNGMNPKDVAHLKFKNIQDGYIVFTRIKTEGSTRHDPKIITVYITQDMQRIMDKWGNKTKKEEDYIFPIMDDSLSFLQQYQLVPAFTQFINDNMKRIATALGIERRITTIYSRHSYSTQMKRLGASTEYIQEALGHMDKKTTENYLDSFGKEIKKEFAEKLLDFKDEDEHETPVIKMRRINL